MHILITNDDGIYSAGIRALADEALRRGHKVTIAAPSKQCSANSQHITLTEPILVHEVPWEGAKAFAIDGTPSDCVRVGLFLTDEPVDFCISGINKGENAGACVYYSGTVGAAREAAMLYVPAIAVSIMRGADERMQENMAKVALKTAEGFKGVTLPRFTLINLNAPALPPEKLKPMVICPLSAAYYLDSYEKRVSPLGQTYFWLKGDDAADVPMEKPEPGSDYAFLQDGHVTCTFLGDFQDYNRDFAAKMQDILE